YGDWDGGRAGHALAVSLGWTLGRARVLAPLALVAGGLALLLREMLSARRTLLADPRSIGAICLFAAATLALAAGTLGVSSGPVTGEASWTSASLQAHGGVAGEALYQLAHRLVQDVGVDILVVFLLLVGAILLTGASLGGALRATGSGLADTTRMMRTLADRRASDAPEGASTEEFAAALGGVRPPEPAVDELIVRATHVEGPAQEDQRSEQSSPTAIAGPTAAGVGEQQDELPEALDGVDDEAEEEIAGVARADAGTLTPQGRLRDAVTEDPGFVWELPAAGKLLTRSTGEQARPDTAGQAQTASSLVEALGHFGVQADVIGTVAGPHITRYELRLAPGTKVAKVAQLKDDLAYAMAATDVRILAPIPGKQAVGVEVPNAHRRIVKLGDVFQQPPKDWSPLTVWLGKDVA